MEIGEQALEIDPILEEYLQKRSGVMGREKVEVLEYDSGKNFYRFRREKPPLPGNSGTKSEEEEVFLNPRISSVIVRRIRSKFQDGVANIQSVELYKVKDLFVTLTVSKSMVPFRDLLFRKKVNVSYKGEYKLDEPSQKEGETSSMHSYKLTYIDGRAGYLIIDLFGRVLTEPQEIEHTPANIFFELKRKEIVGYMNYSNKKVKVVEGKPLQIGSNTLIANQDDKQFNLEITVGDGLIRTFSFPKEINLPAWLAQLNEDGDEWIKKSDQFPVRFGIHSARGEEQYDI